MRALEALGLFDAVLQKLSPGDYSSKGMLMYSGLGDHELIYDVRISQSLSSPIHVKPVGIQYQAVPEDATISMHRYALPSAAFLSAF